MQAPEAFEDHHRARLERVLGTQRRAGPPLSYPQVAGFLYAVVAAPHLVQVSQWWPVILGEGPDLDEASTEPFLGALMARSNRAAQQVGTSEPRFPPGCEPPEHPADAFGPAAPFGQWAEGLLGGHSWLQRDWDAHLAPDQREALDPALTTLAVFADRETATAMLTDAETREDGPRPDVDVLAEASLPLVGNALAAYMTVAEEIRLVLGASGQAGAPDAAQDTPAGPYHRATPRVGRNQPCPCGSGRKYKHCCGRQAG